MGAEVAMTSEPHWHEQNPWKDDLIYVTVEELAACHMRLEMPDNTWGMIEIIAHWAQYGDKLDAYILNSGPVMTAGVRYGPEDSHYLSGAFSLPKLMALRNQHLIPLARKTR